MITDRQGLVLMDVQLGHLVFREAAPDMRVWRGAGNEVAFERDTQEVVLELAEHGLAALPDGSAADSAIRLTAAGATALEEWRDAVRSRRC